MRASPRSGEETRLGQDLADLLSERGWDLVPVARNLDQPLQVSSELVVISTRRAPLQVQLQLEHLRVVQLTVYVPV
jgi:hypothetical protein